MCLHVIFPLFTPGPSPTNTVYTPVVECLRCGKPYDPGTALEPALQRLRARGMGATLAERVREQFRWAKEGRRS